MAQPDDGTEDRPVAGSSAPAPAADNAAGAEISPPRLTGNKRELAAFLKVSVPTVDALVADGCPVLEGGSNGRAYVFDFVAVFNWRRERDEARQELEAKRRRQIDETQAQLFGADDLPEDPELANLSPKARGEIIKARRELLLLLERQKSLVKVDDVILGLAAAFASLKQALLTLPDALQRQFGLSDEVAAASQEAIEDRLNDAVDAAQRAVSAAGGHAKAA